MESLFDERRYLIPFRSVLLPQIFTDTLVIGAGAAGLSAALAASQHADVIVLSKSPLGRSNTDWAQGGIAAVMHAADNPSDHIQDTLTAGAGLCDHHTVSHVINQGPAALQRAFDLGFNPDRHPDGSLQLAKEGGHSNRRIIHADGDATGAALSSALSNAAFASDRIRIFQRCFALDLLTPNDTPGSPCLGAITYHPRHGLQMIWARATMQAGTIAAGLPFTLVLLACCFSLWKGLSSDSRALRASSKAEG